MTKHVLIETVKKTTKKHLNKSCLKQTSCIIIRCESIPIFVFDTFKIYG